MSTITIEQGIERLKLAPKSFPKARDVSKVSQVVRQGDVYVHRVSSIKKGVLLESRKLAPGHTIGSNHIVSDNPKVLIYKSETKTFYKCLPVQIGPVIEARDSWTLTHPKHGWMSRFVPGLYQITFPINPVTKKRLED